MKIITLVENLVYKSHLKSEHGLSIFIEDDDGTKILFDTGQSDLLLSNAKHLKIDLSQVDHLVISHGHYDHTGGLPSFLKINKKAKIYINQSAFLPRYHNGSKYVGMPKIKPAILKGRIYSYFKDELVKISKNIFLVPKIAIKNKWDTHFHDLTIKKDKCFVQDNFEDEQFLLIRKRNKLSIITGCSHRGVSNICYTANLFFDLPIKFILGGTHLIGNRKDKIEKMAQILKGYALSQLGVCHCTGVEEYFLLKKFLTANFKDTDKRSDLDIFYNETGRVILL
ncbi:MAG: MBL fold metallo-hydrolase [Oligoflexia bacterium]|nr:MBL fold metallo-hydrolase [Oligoflexia bacterium]